MKRNEVLPCRQSAVFRCVKIEEVMLFRGESLNSSKCGEWR